jgi:Zn-dependent peptidase ImmA (M78 family)
LRDVAAELMAALPQATPSLVSSATVRDDPEEVAAAERTRFGVSTDTQLAWEPEEPAFREWRGVLEGRGVLVFRFPMPVQDARGFSLAADPLPAIVVSSHDAPNGRIFTLFHEYAHLVLHQPGVCTPRLEPNGDAHSSAEAWCNRFAGAFLVPADSLRADGDVRRLSSHADPRLLSRSARRFSVSAHVLLLRMLMHGWISHDRYYQEVARLTRAYPKKGGGPATPAQRCVAENGRLFPSLVLEAKDLDIITYADVAGYLALRLKHLDSLRSLIDA